MSDSYGRRDSRKDTDRRSQDRRPSRRRFDTPPPPHTPGSSRRPPSTPPRQSSSYFGGMRSSSPDHYTSGPAGLASRPSGPHPQPNAPGSRPPMPQRSLTEDLFGLVSSDDRMKDDLLRWFGDSKRPEQVFFATEASFAADWLLRQQDVEKFMAKENGSTAPVLILESNENRATHDATATTWFAADRVASYNELSPENLVLVYWWCSPYHQSDNGLLLLHQVLGQILASESIRISEIDIPRRNASPNDLDWLLRVFEAAVAALLQRTSLIIMIDAIQSYKRPAPQNANVRRVLQALVTFAGRFAAENTRGTSQIWGFSVVLSTGKTFERLENSADYTTVVTIPGSVHE